MSATVRVIAPMCRSIAPPLPGQLGTRPKLALNPKTPQNDAGIRSDRRHRCPIRSDHPGRDAAAAPPLEPPGVSCVFHGLRVIRTRDCRDSLPAGLRRVRAADENHPRLAQPLDRGQSSVVTFVSSSFEPNVVRDPATCRLSFTCSGTPCNGPSGCPRINASSAFAAEHRASSACTVTRHSRPDCAARSARARTS